MTTKTIKVLRSVEDRSVNFVLPTGQECRYVRRTDDTIIAYLSSHNGCNQACRMCHLTQTKQTDFIPTNTTEFMNQADKVLTHYRTMVGSGKEPPAKTLHYNWMARGEPLLNQHLLDKWKTIREILSGFGMLADIARIKFKISTIIPVTKDSSWFNGPHLPEIYYSIYSVNPEFRKRWLPNAAPLEFAAERLKYHISRGGRLVFHMPFIKGENDSEKDVDNLIQFILDNNLDHAKLNIVRYNPFSEGQGVESDEDTIERHFKRISAFMKQPNSRIVPRVGFDVAASCGCFVSPEADNK